MGSLFPSADYGIAVFVVGGVFYLCGKAIDVYCQIGTKKTPMETNATTSATIVTALENNTKMMQSVVEMLSTMRSTQIQSLTMVEELVAKARVG
jgi:hypothetical protein